MFFWRRRPNVNQLAQRKDIDALIAAAKHDDRQVRADAIAALAEIGDERALDILISAVDNHSHRDDLIVAAIGGLARLGHPQAAEAIRRTLRYHDLPAIRTAGAKALAIFGDAAAVDDLLFAASVFPLGMSKQERQIVRYEMTGAIAHIYARDPAVVDRLIEVALDKRPKIEGPPEVAAEVLGNLGDARAVKPLLKLLRHNSRSQGLSFAVASPSVAAASLAKLGPVGFDGLVAALKHPDDYVRQSAVQSIPPNPDSRTLELLLLALKDESCYVRRATVRRLSEAGGPQVLEGLKLAMRDEDQEVRITAAATLAASGSSDHDVREELRDTERRKRAGEWSNRKGKIIYSVPLPERLRGREGYGLDSLDEEYRARDRDAWLDDRERQERTRLDEARRALERQWQEQEERWRQEDEARADADSPPDIRCRSCHAPLRQISSRPKRDSRCPFCNGEAGNWQR